MSERTQSSLTGKERWTSHAQYFEYSKAANPIGSGRTSPVPLADFPSRLHEGGPTRVIPFDLSDQLRCSGPATSPAVWSRFRRDPRILDRPGIRPAQSAAR